LGSGFDAVESLLPDIDLEEMRMGPPLWERLKGLFHAKTALMNRQAICIVDDDHRELARFKNALRDRFHVGTGASPELALRDLDSSGKLRPDLYLLDLYEPHSPISMEDAARKLQDARKKFLKAVGEFQRVLAECGQTTGRSFENAKRLRGPFRAQPFAFFSRKGTLEDVTAAHVEFGLVPIIKKPEPDPKSIRDESDLEQLYDKALEENVDRLEADILRAIHNCNWWWQYRSFIFIAVIVAYVVGVASSLTASLIWHCLSSH
jgi:hypothetical protein